MTKPILFITCLFFAPLIHASSSAGASNGCTDSSKCCVLNNCYNGQCTIHFTNKTTSGRDSNHQSLAQSIQIVAKDKDGKTLGNRVNIGSSGKQGFKLGNSARDNMDHLVIRANNADIFNARLKCAELKKIVASKDHHCKVYIDWSLQMADPHCSGIASGHDAGWSKFFDNPE